MMVANAASTNGGFGANSPAEGPTAGTSTKMGKVKKKRNHWQGMLSWCQKTLDEQWMTLELMLLS